MEDRLVRGAGSILDILRANSLLIHELARKSSWHNFLIELLPSHKFSPGKLVGAGKILSTANRLLNFKAFGFANVEEFGSTWQRHVLLAFLLAWAQVDDVARLGHLDGVTESGGGSDCKSGFHGKFWLFDNRSTEKAV